MKFFKKLIHSTSLPKYSGRGMMMMFLYSSINVFYGQTVISGIENIKVSAGTKIYVADQQENKANDKQLKALYLSEDAVVYNKEQITLINTPEIPEETAPKRYDIAKHHIPAKPEKQKDSKEKAPEKTISPVMAFKANTEGNDSAFGISRQQSCAISISPSKDTLPKVSISKNTFAGFFPLSAGNTPAPGAEILYINGIHHSAYSSRPPPVLQT